MLSDLLVYRMIVFHPVHLSQQGVDIIDDYLHVIALLAFTLGVEFDPDPAVPAVIRNAEDKQFFPGDSFRGDIPPVLAEADGNKTPVRKNPQDRGTEILPGSPDLQDSAVFECDHILFPDNLVQDSCARSPVLVEMREYCPERLRERWRAPGGGVPVTEQQGIPLLSVHELPHPERRGNTPALSQLELFAADRVQYRDSLIDRLDVHIGTACNSFHSLPRATPVLGDLSECLP